jgi:hypothetical protein
MPGIRSALGIVARLTMWLSVLSLAAACAGTGAAPVTPIRTPGQGVDPISRMPALRGSTY